MINNKPQYEKFQKDTSYSAEGSTEDGDDQLTRYAEELIKETHH